MFLAAVRFPNDVKARGSKGIQGYNHRQWHYMDNPITPKGDPTVGPQPEPPNAMESLAGQLAGMNRLSSSARSSMTFSSTPSSPISCRNSTPLSVARSRPCRSVSAPVSRSNARSATTAGRSRCR